MSSNSAHKIEIEKLVRDPEKLQARIEVDHRLVEQYARSMRAGAPFPPIKVYDVEGALLLVDGYHRVAAAELVAEAQETFRPKIAAEIVPGTMTEAVRAAALANITHGKPLKRKEHREAFRMLGHSGALKGMNARSIADLMNNVVSHVTIWTWANEDFPGLLERKSKKGQKPEDRDVWEADPLTASKAKQLAALGGVSQAYKLVEAGVITESALLNEIAATAKALLNEAIRQGGDPDEEFIW